MIVRPRRDEGRLGAKVYLVVGMMFERPRLTLYRKKLCTTSDDNVHSTSIPRRPTAYVKVSKVFVIGSKIYLHLHRMAARSSVYFIAFYRDRV